MLQYLIDRMKTVDRPMPAYRIIILSTSVVFIIGMIRGENPFKSYLELSASKQVLANTVQELEGKVGYLNREIEKITRSPSYAQKVLRDKYHVLEENESIIFFAD